MDELKISLKRPKKKWVTVGDSKVRKTHSAINGQTRLVKNPFKVKGGHLMFPGDTSLGVDMSEIYNCRCDVIYL